MDATDGLAEQQNSNFTALEENARLTYAEADISYTRADGTVEHAVSAEEAIARCPVLGKMPLEQANVLLELANVGRQKLNESQTYAVTDSFKREHKSSASEAGTKEPTQKIVDKLTVREWLEAKARNANQEAIEEPSTLPEQVQLEPVKAKTNNTNRPIAPQTLPEPRPDKLSQVKQTASQKPLPHTTIFATKPEPASVTVKEPSVGQPADTNQADIFAQPEVIIFNEYGTREPTQPNEYLAEEAIDAFEELIASLEISEEGVVLVPESATDDFEYTEVDVFEEFMADQPQLEALPSIETLQPTANDQPLEETLVSIARLLEKAPKQDENIKEMTELLGELVEAFDDSISDETKEFRLTPEITEKILALLRLIGYENPKQALLEMVSRHDLEFLLQAIRYLAQLANHDNQQESWRLKYQTHSFANLLEPQTIKVGKLVLGLIRTNIPTAA